MVFDRSFVLEAASQVQLEVLGDESGVLSADGRRSIELPVGSAVRIRASARPARFVRRDDAPGFLSLVREKFGLPGGPTNGRATPTPTMSAPEARMRACCASSTSRGWGSSTTSIWRCTPA